MAMEGSHVQDPLAANNKVATVEDDEFETGEVETKQLQLQPPCGVSILTAHGQVLLRLYC